MKLANSSNIVWYYSNNNLWLIKFILGIVENYKNIKSESLSIEIPEELKKQLIKKTKVNDISLSNFIYDLLEKYVYELFWYFVIWT